MPTMLHDTKRQCRYKTAEVAYSTDGSLGFMEKFSVVMDGTVVNVRELALCARYC